MLPVCSRMKKTLKRDVMTWKCLPNGRKQRKKKKVRSWIGIGRQIDAGQRRGLHAGEHPLEAPCQRKDCGGGRAFALRGEEASLEHAFGDHQCGDETEDEQRLGGVVLAVFLGDGVPRGLEEGAAHGEDRHGHEDCGGGEVLDDVVDRTEGAAETGQDEAIHEAENHQLRWSGRPG